MPHLPVCCIIDDLLLLFLVIQRWLSHFGVVGSLSSKVQIQILCSLSCSLFVFALLGFLVGLEIECVALGESIFLFQFDVFLQLFDLFWIHGLELFFSGSISTLFGRLFRRSKLFFLFILRQFKCFSYLILYIEFFSFFTLCCRFRSYLRLFCLRFRF